MNRFVQVKKKREKLELIQLWEINQSNGIPTDIRCMTQFDAVE